VKRLHCVCGRTVYFDNHRCGHCGRQLGFDPQALAMTAEAQVGDGLRHCKNHDSVIRCNWLASPDNDACLSCRTSQIIPSLSKPENHGRWRKLEQAKRRLLYNLLRLDLPVDPARLRFVFKEDRRTNPDVHDDHVSIGHADGVITINAAEADEVYREQMRQQMNEPYRTLLGHFRHESGHYYFNVVVSADLLEEARGLFGDESSDYDTALQSYYWNGPRAGWEERYISGYASAHPAEDWAECWAHYLHIRAVLETANAQGLRTNVDLGNWEVEFIELMLSVNEVLRSMGLPDAYPFVITATIAEKIEFVHKAVSAFSGRQDALSAAG
jgi:hypothetical protein